MAEAWTPLVAAGGLAVATVVAVAYDAALAARSAGAPVSVAAPLHEVSRLLVQRRRTTPAPDALLWRLGGGGLLVVALLMAAVVPVGGHAVADLPVGVVWFNVLDIAVWAVVWLAGWGANSLLPLVGGYRFLAQAMAYELPLMFALTTAALGAGSLRVGDVVAAQAGLWFVVWMPAAFAVYLACVLAFSLWGPFGYPTGSDLAGGVLAEVAGVDRLLLLAGRWALLVAGTAFAVPLFLGGGAGPLLPAWLWSLVKMAALLALVVPLRRRLPTLRADRLVEVGWLVAIPVMLVQLFVVSLIVLGRP